jgi:hypothetical protein
MSSSPRSGAEEGAQKFGLPELIPLRVSRQCTPLDGRRVNLIIPAISRQTRSFGGLATALRFLERLRSEFAYARLVVTHEISAAVEPLDWPGWDLGGGESARQGIVFLPEPGATLPVAANDCFVSTFWSTAIYSKQVLQRQLQWFPSAVRRYVYLIQEYEPAFYPGSARHEYAKSTYRDDGWVIPIFNSTPVKRYFDELGVRFSEQYTFDPMFHPTLQIKHAELRDVLKQRLILVYGRPGEAQNDFDLAVESLRIWADAYQSAREWVLVSAGLPHPPVRLADGVTLQSCGTLGLDEYALYLARSWAGISFTFNASTSYTAREMAEFGAWVITNQFEYRKPEDLPPNVLALDEATPENVARKLIWCCNQFRPGATAVVPHLGAVFRRDGAEFPFVDSLLKSWLSQQMCQSSPT